MTSAFPPIVTKRRHQILRSINAGNACWRYLSNGIIFSQIIGVSGKLASTFELDQLITMGLVVRTTKPARPDVWLYELTIAGIAVLDQANDLVGVHVLDEGTLVTVYLSDRPIDSADNLLDPLVRRDVVVLARTWRVFAHAGGGWKGWIVEIGGTNYPLRDVSKETAISYVMGEAANANRRMR